MASSTVAFATLFFSRQTGASPAGVLANIASCKCLTAPGNGELKTTDCTTDLENLGSQSFYTDDSDDVLFYPPGQVCVGATDHEMNHSIIGQRAEFRNCTSEGSWVVTKSTSTLWANKGRTSHLLKRAEDDTLVFAEPSRRKLADDEVFEFHCAACLGDEGWTCGGAPDPTPAPLGNTTTSAPPPPNTTLAPDTTPAPSAGVQIQFERFAHQHADKVCMDLPGGDTSNGALLWMWDCSGGDSQRWSFQDGQLVYWPDPSKCVDLLGGDTSNGNKLGIWDCNQGDSQMWGFDSEWGTIYLASSTASDATKCASVGDAFEGEPVYIWDCTDLDPLYQEWKVGPPEDAFSVV